MLTNTDYNDIENNINNINNNVLNLQQSTAIHVSGNKTWSASNEGEEFIFYSIPSCKYALFFMYLSKSGGYSSQYQIEVGSGSNYFNFGSVQNNGDSVSAYVHYYGKYNRFVVFDEYFRYYNGNNLYLRVYAGEHGTATIRYDGFYFT